MVFLVTEQSEDDSRVSWWGRMPFWILLVLALLIALTVWSVQCAVCSVQCIESQHEESQAMDL